MTRKERASRPALFLSLYRYSAYSTITSLRR
jgi:hypothetical protein